MGKLRLIILSKITNLVGGRVENPLYYSFCLSQLGITKFFTATNDFFHTLINFRDTDKIPLQYLCATKLFSWGRESFKIILLCLSKSHTTLRVHEILKINWFFFFLVSPCGKRLAVYFCVCCFFWNYLSILKLLVLLHENHSLFTNPFFSWS